MRVGLRRQPDVRVSRQRLDGERIDTAVQQKGDGCVPDNIARYYMITDDVERFEAKTSHLTGEP